MLIITGILIAKSRGVLGIEFRSTYGVFLFVKHLLVLIMIINGVLISAVFSPQLKPVLANNYAELNSKALYDQLLVENS